MTPRQYADLRPGDLLRDKRDKRKLRLVMTTPGYVKWGTQSGPIGIRKIGHSWTDPNPAAYYDAWFIRKFFSLVQKGFRTEKYVARLLRFKKRSRTKRHNKRR